MIKEPFETISNFFDKPKFSGHLRSKPSNFLQYTFQRQLTAKKVRPRFLFTPFVKRLELKHTLEGHWGCVNTLKWSDSGEHLVSGSDDCMINIWNIPSRQLMTTYHSGHMGNILSAIFVSPMKTIATCGADACLRISDVETQTSHILWDAQRWNRMFKVKYEPTTPHVIYSTCSDGTVRLHDMRLRSTEEATLVVDHRKNKFIFGRTCGRTVGVYDVSFHPWTKHQIATAGEDPYIRIYDIRMTNPNPIYVFCPLKLHHLSDGKRNELSVTSVTHNKYGNRLLATYIGDNIYSFDYQDRLHVGLLKKPEDYQNYQMEYSGHINQQTIKEVNYFGEDEEFVISGSDDGFIYLWETATAHLVKRLRGDNDIVNVVQGHPYGYPILASSGFESNIKIWEPGDDMSNQNTATKEDCVLL